VSAPRETMQDAQPSQGDHSTQAVIRQDGLEHVRSDIDELTAGRSEGIPRGETVAPAVAEETSRLKVVAPSVDVSRTANPDEPQAEAGSKTSKTRERKPTPPGTLQCTDTANAERFAARWTGQARYSPPRKRWFVWDGTRWNDDSLTSIMEMAKETARAVYLEAGDPSVDANQAMRLGEWAKLSLSAGRLQAMLTLAQSIPGIATHPNSFDRDPYLLNTPAGTVDLRTGKMRAHNPDDLIRQITKVAPSSAEPTRWLAFLEKIFAGDQKMVDYMQQLLGYSLLGRVEQHLLVICWGRGQNGKSTLLETVKTLVGEYGYALPDGALVKTRNSAALAPWYAQLYGKRFVIGSESEREHELSEAFVNSLTGGDTRNAKLLYENNFEYTPSDTIFFGTNYRPSLSGSADGIWRRLRLVPFGVKIADDEVITDFADRLIREEGSAILGWLIQGCVAYLAGGSKLETPEAVKKATASYREESDSVGAFMDECTKSKSDCDILSSRLHEMYCEWCEHTGQHMLGRKAFSSELRDRGYKIEHKRTGSFVRDVTLISAEPTGTGRPGDETEQVTSDDDAEYGENCVELPDQRKVA